MRQRLRTSHRASDCGIFANRVSTPKARAPRHRVPYDRRYHYDKHDAADHRAKNASGLPDLLPRRRYHERTAIGTYSVSGSVPHPGMLGSVETGRVVAVGSFVSAAYGVRCSRVA